MAQLIRAFGEYWSPDHVDWGRGSGGRGMLHGEFGTKRSSYLVDVWDQRGIYILYDAWQPVYVGKAAGNPLGSRLKRHLYDRHAGRWDRFSWYGVRGVTRKANHHGDLGVLPERRSVDVSDLINTLEAFLLAVEPPRNRRKEKLPEAVEVLQANAERPKPTATHLQDIRAAIDHLDSRLDDLDDRLDFLSGDSGHGLP